jgi:anti-sigma factor RsiW
MKTADMRCADVEKLVHPYVDGELVADDNAALEGHVTDCERCRALVGFHSGFKATVRARLRPRHHGAATSRPEPPERLKLAVMKALDEADARGEGPVPKVWRRFAPAGSAVFVAAAAIAFFIGVTPTPVAEAESPIVDEAIRAHEKNLPVEVGGDEDRVASWMQGKVSVPVRPPRIGADGTALVGGRVYHLRNRDVGQLVYRINAPRATTRTMTVYVFDPSGWDFAAPRSTVRRVGGHDIYLSQERGYTVALLRDRGVGYAFASDLAGDDMLRLVAASMGDGPP